MCLLGFLAFVGVGVYHFVPDRPLCILQGDFGFAQLSDDGCWVLTQRAFHEEDPDEVRIWNAYTGSLERTFSTSRAVTVLPDSRHFMWYDPDDKMHLVDWRNDKTWSPQIKFGLWDYNARGRWRAVYEFPDDKPTTLSRHHLFDAHQHRVIRQLNHGPFAFTNDERLIVGLTSENDITVEDAATGRHLATIGVKFACADKSDVNEAWNDIRLSLDSRWLIRALDTTRTLLDALQFEGDDPRKPNLFCRNAKGFEIWELATGKRGWRFESSKAHLRSVLVSPDGSVLATWPTNAENSLLELFDTATGRPVATVTIKRAWRAEFSSDSTLLLLHHIDGPEIVMIDAACGQVLWKATSTDLTRFIDSDTVIQHADESAPLEILDARSGALKHRLLGHHVLDSVFTPDRCWAAFSGHPWAGRKLDFWEPWLERWFKRFGDDAATPVFVADLKTGRIRFCVQLPKVERYYLSDNGTTLVTIDRDGSRVGGTNGGPIQVWDVHRTRARLWGGSASLALGTALLLLRRWRQSRKPRQRSSQPVGS